jgi:hypothetical protein
VETNRPYGEYWIASDFDSEFMETIEVAIEIGGGKAVTTARLAIEVMEKVKQGNYDPAEY